MGGGSKRSTAGPKRRAQADSQLGNASSPDLKTHGKQSSHSCAMAYGWIELITCLPGTYSYVCETSHGNVWRNSASHHKLCWQNDKYLWILSFFFFFNQWCFLVQKMHFFSSLNLIRHWILKKPPCLMFRFWSKSLSDYLMTFIFQKNISKSSMKCTDATILKHKTNLLFLSNHTLIKRNIRK